MEDDDVQMFRIECRQLAKSIVRDDVSSDELSAYLSERISIELVEPHSCCRIAAADIAKRYPGMTPRHVAAELLRAARRYRPQQQNTQWHLPPSHHSAQSDNSPQASSTIPEIGFAVAFVTVGLLLLVAWLAQIVQNPLLGWDNWEWSLGVSCGYLFTGILYLYSAFGQFHCNRRRSQVEAAAASKDPDATTTTAPQRGVARFHTWRPRGA